MKMTFKNPNLDCIPPRLFISRADRPMGLLANCPAYQPTPLSTVPRIADELGIQALHIKDETNRMRLGSFKALGGAYAVAQIIMDASACADPLDDRASRTASGMTFITASAGNHGLSVAAGARIFGANAAVVLCTSVPEAFADRIRALGADVIRTRGTYEDSVAKAISTAEEKGWVHLADGSWPGYIDRPALVMEGYTVLAEECRSAFSNSGSWPTHVFLQAGVGGFAAAIAAHIRDAWEEQPQIIIVEPDAAPCLLASVRAGKLTRADGPVSEMGRLDCKEASLIAFQSLLSDADYFTTVSEAQARETVSMLARCGIETTPSGAAGLAAVSAFGLGTKSRCLVVATEGREDG